MCLKSVNPLCYNLVFWNLSTVLESSSTEDFHVCLLLPKAAPHLRVCLVSDWKLMSFVTLRFLVSLAWLLTPAMVYLILLLFFLCLDYVDTRFILLSVFILLFSSNTMKITLCDVSRPVMYVSGTATSCFTSSTLMILKISKHSCTLLNTNNSTGILCQNCSTRSFNWISLANRAVTILIRCCRSSFEITVWGKEISSPQFTLDCSFRMLKHKVNSISILVLGYLIHVWRCRDTALFELSIDWQWRQNAYCFYSGLVHGYQLTLI